ncbi:MAG: hypothetical protein M1840_005930 [Geoglossum simile]|nr:MAG: hypothetical protein M1840_005930 [Geoglossum simile]
MPVLRQRALNLSDSSTDSSGSGGSFTASGLSPSPTMRTLGILIQHLNLRSNEWIALDVFRRGWSHEPIKCEPTIVITLKRGTEVSGVWDAIVQNIREVSIAKCGSTIEVEILLGELSRLGQSSWEEIPAIGSSIGLAGSLSSGTIGGFLDLRTSSQTVRVGLTCHHVLCAEHSEAIPMGSESSIVNQPSDIHQVQELGKSLEETRLDMERLNELIGRCGNDAFNKICSNHMATVKTQLELAANFRRRVGTIFATSGLRLPPEPILNGVIIGGITPVDSITPIQVGSSVIRGSLRLDGQEVFAMR